MLNRWIAKSTTSEIRRYHIGKRKMTVIGQVVIWALLALVSIRVSADSCEPREAIPRLGDVRFKTTADDKTGVKFDGYIRFSNGYQETYLPLKLERVTLVDADEEPDADVILKLICDCATIEIDLEFQEQEDGGYTGNSSAVRVNYMGSSFVTYRRFAKFQKNMIDGNPIYRSSWKRRLVIDNRFIFPSMWLEISTFGFAVQSKKVASRYDAEEKNPDGFYCDL